MHDPVKIWTRIQDAFTKLEIEDIAVEEITLPRRWLDNIIKKPTTLGRDLGWHDDMLCFVTNPHCKRCMRIFGARVRIGPKLRVA